MPPENMSAFKILSKARILEWVAIPFSRKSSQPRDWTWVSFIAGRFFTVWASWEAWKMIWDWGNRLFVPLQSKDPRPWTPAYVRDLGSAQTWGAVCWNIGTLEWPCEPLVSWLEPSGQLVELMRARGRKGLIPSALRVVLWKGLLLNSLPDLWKT